MNEHSILEKHFRQLTAGGFGDFRTFSAARRALDLIPVSHGKVLDIGCGSGVFVDLAIRDGYDVLGIDISDSQIRLAKHLLGVRGFPPSVVRVATVDDLLAESKEDTYSVAILLDVLEHLDTPIGFLRMVNRLLCRRGFTIVSVPAHQALFDEGDVEIGHKLRYSRERLRDNLEQAGFAVDFIGYWSLLGLIHRMVSKTLGLRSSRTTYSFRYKSDAFSRSLNRILALYFLGFENRFVPPIGLTLFARAVAQS